MMQPLTERSPSRADPRGGAAQRTPRDESRPRICVVGVGGAGCNALRHMVRRGVDGVDFIAVNTDPPALGASAAESILLTREGRTATDAPEIGRSAARHALPQIRRALAGANICFIAAGMGGGTGTGAAPVIARVARDMGILAVVVVTKPFSFEGRRRQRSAERGIAELRRTADALIVIPNDNLLRTADASTTISTAFQAADEVLEQGVRSITDLIVRPGIVDVDFADVRAVMQGMGKAVLGTGEASGPRRALDAADRAVGNPLPDGALDGARKLLISIVGGDDLRLAEIDEAAKSITARVHPDAQIIWGSAHDPRLRGRIRVSVVATGIATGPVAARPAHPVRCRRGGHAPGPGATFNQGFHFATCRNCGSDLIRSGAMWRRVPDGFRVVWRGAGRAGPAATNEASAARGLYRRPVRPGWWQMSAIGLDLLRLRASQWLGEIGAWRGPRSAASSERASAPGCQSCA